MEIDDSVGNMSLAAAASTYLRPDVASIKRGPGAPKLKGLDHKRLRQLFRFVNADVPIKDLHIVMEEGPSVTNTHGFTIGKSTVRDYFTSTMGMFPGKFQKLGNKSIRDERNNKFFERFRSKRLPISAPVAPAILSDTTESNPDNSKNIDLEFQIPDLMNSFAGSVDLVPSTPGLTPNKSTPGAPTPDVSTPDTPSHPYKEAYLKEVQNLNAQPILSELMHLARPNLPPTHRVGVSKRACPYTDDGEDSDRILRKSPVNANTSDPKVDETDGFGVFLESLSRPHNRTNARTVADVARDMGKPVDYIESFRYSVNSSINSSLHGTWKTVRSGASPSSIASDLTSTSPDPRFRQPKSPPLPETSVFKHFVDQSFDADKKVADDLRELLSDLGPDAVNHVNHRNLLNQLPLEVAITKGWWQTCIALLDYGADVNLPARNGLKLSKFSREVKRTPNDDIKQWYGIAACHKIITTYVRSSQGYSTKSGAIGSSEAVMPPIPQSDFEPQNQIHSLPQPYSTVFAPLERSNGVGPSQTISQIATEQIYTHKPVQNWVGHFDSMNAITENALEPPYMLGDLDFVDGPPGPNFEHQSMVSETLGPPVTQVISSMPAVNFSFPRSTRESRNFETPGVDPPMLGEFHELPDGGVGMTFRIHNMNPSQIPLAPRPLLHRSENNRGHWILGSFSSFVLPNDFNGFPQNMTSDLSTSTIMSNAGPVFSTNTGMVSYPESTFPPSRLELIGNGSSSGPEVVSSNMFSDIINQPLTVPYGQGRFFESIEDFLAGL